MIQFYECNTRRNLIFKKYMRKEGATIYIFEVRLTIPTFYRLGIYVSLIFDLYDFGRLYSH